MTFSWLSHDFLMTFSWFSHDLLINFSCLSHDFLITLLWISHDFLINISWFSHDFLWLFELAMVCAVSALVPVQKRHGRLIGDLTVDLSRVFGGVISTHRSWWGWWSSSQWRWLYRRRWSSHWNKGQWNNYTDGKRAQGRLQQQKVKTTSHPTSLHLMNSLELWKMWRHLLKVSVVPESIKV